jgi:hypothetical protein
MSSSARTRNSLLHAQGRLEGLLTLNNGPSPDGGHGWLAARSATHLCVSNVPSH